MATDHRQELVDFIVREALDPVMRARPEGLSDADKRLLERVRKATQAEIERYREYRSAEEVVTNFKRDLTSRPAKKVHAELKRLDLPTLDDIRDRFEQRARELGVNAGA